MEQKDMPRADFIMGIILMAFTLFIVVESVKMPRFEQDWGAFYAGPGFVTMIFGLCTFGMSLYLWWRALKNKGYRIRVTKEMVVAFIRSRAVHRWCLIMGYAFGYFFLLGYLSFYVLTFLFLLGFIWTFGKRKLVGPLIISLLTSITIYLVFTRIFLVPLP